MKMTMYYVHAVGEKRDIHLNFPAVNSQNAYDAFKAEMGDKVTVTEIKPLFEFDYEEQKAVVLN